MTRAIAVFGIKAWLESNLQDYLKVCDPFFGPSELTALRLIRAVDPSTRVSILTSKRHHRQEGVKEPWEDTYRSYWRLEISDQEPPETEVTIIGTRSDGSSPIHDRWWLTRGAGLRIGTSFNGLGGSKESEVSVLTEAESEEHEAEVDRYLNRAVRDHLGEKLQYQLFTLG